MAALTAPPPAALTGVPIRPFVREPCGHDEEECERVGALTDPAGASAASPLPAGAAAATQPHRLGLQTAPAPAHGLEQVSWGRPGADRSLDRRRETAPPLVDLAGQSCATVGRVSAARAYGEILTGRRM
jgi:hypothetical protein